jgi:hypothetical protein
MNCKKMSYSVKRFLLFIKIVFFVTSGMVLAQSKDNSAQPRLVIVLLDETDSFGTNTSRGVADSLYWNDALRFTKTIVKQLKSGDEFAVLAIDEKGFEEEDILIPFQQLERTFLRAKVQKNKLGSRILQLKRRKERYTQTDILGAMYQSAYFANKEPGRETVIFCFSDMRQEPNWPTMNDAKNLSFPPDAVGHFFFVDASGKEEWEQLTNVWKPIFTHAGLTVSTGNSNSLNFYQHGESSLRIQNILSEW